MTDGIINRLNILAKHFSFHKDVASLVMYYETFEELTNCHHNLLRSLVEQYIELNSEEYSFAGLRRVEMIRSPNSDSQYATPRRIQLHHNQVLIEELWLIEGHSFPVSYLSDESDKRGTAIRKFREVIASQMVEEVGECNIALAHHLVGYFGVMQSLKVDMYHYTRAILRGRQPFQI